MYSIKTDLGVLGNITQDTTKTTTLGNTSVKDLTVSGVVTLNTVSLTSLNVSGLSNLNNIALTGNITGDASTVSVNQFVVSGSDGILQFSYNDPSRPSDIKSSIEPYQISTNKVLAKELNTDSASIGVVNGSAGLHALGKANIDYLKIAGNSTIGTASPQLEVVGKTVLGDVEFKGTATGLTVDVSGQDITPESVVAQGVVKANTLESVTTTTVGTNLNVKQNASILGTLSSVGAEFSGDVSVPTNKLTVKDLHVTGTTTGVTVDANVDGLDIAPNSVDVTTTLDVTGKTTLSDAEISGTLTGKTGAAVKIDKVSITGTGTGLSVANNASIVGTLSVTGKSTMTDLDVTGTLSPANINLSSTDVSAKSISTTEGANIGGDLVVAGTVDLSATDVSAKSITTTEASTLPILNSTTATIGTLNATNSTIGDLSVTGTLTPANIDLSATDVSAKSISTTEGANIGGNLVVAGTVDLSQADVTAKSITTTEASTLPILNSTTATIGTLNATTVVGTGKITAGSFETIGAIKAGSVESATIQAQPAGAGTVTLASDVVAAKSLRVEGEFTPAGGLNLSTVDVKAKSLETTGDVIVGGSIDLSNADVNALSFVSTDPLKTNTLPTLSSTTATISTANVTTLSVSGDSGVTGKSTVGELEVTGNTSLQDVNSVSITTSGSVSAGSFTSTASKITMAKNTEVSGDLNVVGTLTAGVIDLSSTDVTVKSLVSDGNAHVKGDLVVDGQFDLSSTNITGATLKSTGSTTVGTDLILTTGVVTGSPKVSGTLDVTGKTTVDVLSAGESDLKNTNVTGTLKVSGVSTLAHTVASSLSVNNTATLGSLAVPTGDVSFGSTLSVSGDSTVQKLTVKGQFIPEGGFNLTNADISAKSITLSAGVIVGTTLKVNGDSTFEGVSSKNTSITGTLDVSGASTLSSVAVSSITSSGTMDITGDSTLKKTKIETLLVGSGAEDVDYPASIYGNTKITGNLDVTGTINAQINLTGRDISPRSVIASANISAGGTLSITGQSTLSSAIIGEVGSVNNNLQVNGNVVCSGDFTVQGSIIGTLDQTTSAVVAKSLESTTFTKTSTLEVTSTSTFAGKITGTGGAEFNTINSTGLATLNSVSIPTTLGVSGITTVGVINSVESNPGKLSVSGVSTFTGKATAVDFESTGTITANNLTVTGTITADVADLVTESIVTKAYFVTPNSDTVSTATWTPSGTSNVENVSVTAGTTVQAIPNVKGAGSWYFYFTQDATGGHSVNFESTYNVTGTINTAPNSVSICQVMYCGVGSVYDVFIFQR